MIPWSLAARNKGSLLLRQGTDRLYSRRALSVSGAALTKLAAGLIAVVLDEADALLLSKELAIVGPPRRKSYRELSGMGPPIAEYHILRCAYTCEGSEP